MNPREDLKKIYTSAIDSVNPKNAVKSHMRIEKSTLVVSAPGGDASFDLRRFKKIYVVGAGKATALMASAAEEIFGTSITRGCISVKYGYTAPLKFIETIEASHPVPDEQGVLASKKICGILDETGKDDLVISLISGGGSSLLPFPPEDVSLEDKRAATGLLLKSGASIHEVNAVRKHLSRVKGGNLARRAAPSTVINLMMSDVVGDNMDVIASGLFVPDNSTFASALEILKKYHIDDKVPPAVYSHISAGARGDIEENPGTGDGAFRKTTNIIIASNIIALKAARNTADGLGYHTMILSSLIEGDTQGAAQIHAAIAREVHASGNPLSKPACVISGGETTVVVKGNGLGGRNMEFALQASTLIDGYDNITMASIGTDGSDGPTDAAGAIADGTTLRRALSMGIKVKTYLESNDSYHFFEKTGDLVITGPTNTNVMDVRIMIIT